VLWFSVIKNYLKEKPSLIFKDGF